MRQKFRHFNYVLQQMKHPLFKNMITKKDFKLLASEKIDSDF